MDYVSFNGAANAVPYPNDFQMMKEPNIVAEITTMSGQTIADVNGWKFADTTLQWDYLPDEYLKIILEETDPITKGVFKFGFYEMQHSVTRAMNGQRPSRVARNALRKSAVSTKTCFHTKEGYLVWKDVEMTLSFPDVYFG